jgi:hypothetical protein
MFPFGELSWQLPPELAGCSFAAGVWACAAVGNAAGRTGARRNANETSSEVQRRAVSLAYAPKWCNFIFLELERTFMSDSYLHEKIELQNSAD